MMEFAFMTIGGLLVGILFAVSGTASSAEVQALTIETSKLRTRLEIQAKLRSFGVGDDY